MRSALAFASVLAACCTCLAQDRAPRATPPEALLSADTVFYFRYDGYEPHRRAYDRTALAKIMKEDLGEVYDALARAVKDTVAGSLQDQGNAEQAEPANGEQARQRKRLERLLELGPRFLDYFWRHGVVVGVEVRGIGVARLLRGPSGGTCCSVAPLAAAVGTLGTTLQAEAVPAAGTPQEPGDLTNRRENAGPALQTTFIFPEAAAGENRAVVVPFLEALIDGMDAKVQKRRVGRRTIHEAKCPDCAVAWWEEGRHVVCVYTDDVARALGVARGKRPNLTASPLYRAVAGFDRYETDMRGFVDVEKLVGLLLAPDESADRWTQLRDAVTTRLFLGQLGLTGLKDLRFHLGFDGKCQRSTILLRVPDPDRRTGLLRLISAGLPFDSQQLPALPPDAEFVSVHHVNWLNVHDILERVVLLLQMSNLLKDGTLPDGPLTLRGQLGFDVRGDVLGALDSSLVVYNALSEGPFILGQGLAIKVKDERRLRKGLRALDRALHAGKEGGWSFQKRTYRGADLFVLQGPGSIPVTYTIHRGWLVVGAFPQSVKGCLLRSGGGHPAWKAPPLLREALEQARQAGGPNSKLGAVTVTDPRPAAEVGLSLLPAAVHFLSEGALDASALPNARTVADRLFPGVTVFYDDGDALRWESHYSVWVPGSWWILLCGQIDGSFALPQRWTAPAAAHGLSANGSSRRDARDSNPRLRVGRR